MHINVLLCLGVAVFSCAVKWLYSYLSTSQHKTQPPRAVIVFLNSHGHEVHGLALFVPTQGNQVCPLEHQAPKRPWLILAEEQNFEGLANEPGQLERARLRMIGH